MIFTTITFSIKTITIIIMIVFIIAMRINIIFLHMRNLEAISPSELCSGVVVHISGCPFDWWNSVSLHLGTGDIWTG